MVNIFPLVLGTWVAAEDSGSCDRAISKDNSTPLLLVIPGLTSDSSAAVSPCNCSTKSIV
jgi:hypothetical protein